MFSDSLFSGQPHFDALTVITAIEGEGLLTKVWSGPNGETVEPAANARLFNFETVQVDGLDGLESILRRLAGASRSAVIRGGLKSDLPPWLAHPRRSRETRDRGAATIDDVPRHWVGVDLDDLVVAPWLEPGAIAAYARTLLPYPFSAAPCVWQLSASTGSAKKRAVGTAGVHLWFWLDEARSSHALRSFFAAYPRVDRSLFKAAGIHFTADPVSLTGSRDPYAGQRIGRLDGWARCSVPAIAPEIRREKFSRVEGGGERRTTAEIERFVSAMERSNALRSKTGTVRREARLAFLDVLVNDMGLEATEDELWHLFLRVCIGEGDGDAESDFVEALSWVERPGADRLGAGSLLLEAEGSALAVGDVALLHELRGIKAERHKAMNPSAADMMAAAVAHGFVTKEAPVAGPVSELMAALQASGFVATGVSSADAELDLPPVNPGTGAAGQSLADFLCEADADNEQFETTEDVNGVIVRKPFLLTEDNGKVALKGGTNARRMLKFLGIGVRWNDWTCEREICESGTWRKMTDADWSTVLTDVHHPAYYYPVGEGDFRRAVETIGMRNRVDPMRDYLMGLAEAGGPADGEDWSDVTLESWLPKFTQCADDAYNRAVGRYLIGGMIRRILVPGCKSDEMAVLISKAQGVGKSTLCKLIAPELGDGRSTFTDDLGLGADPKEVLELTGGIAVVEFSELVAARGSDIEHIKGMVSRTADSARMAYGRETTTRPRRFIMIGTSNDETPLRDESGNRRFLPLRLRDDVEIDLDGLRAVRARLWALAVRELVASGMAETFRLDRSLWAEAKGRQEAALGRGIGEQLLLEMLGPVAEAGTESVASRDMVLWRSKYAKMADQAFAGAMRRLGFENRVVWEAGKAHRRWVREGEGLTGSATFVYDHDRGTFGRSVAMVGTAVVSEFKPPG